MRRKFKRNEIEIIATAALLQKASNKTTNNNNNNNRKTNKQTNKRTNDNKCYDECVTADPKRDAGGVR